MLFITPRGVQKPNWILNIVLPCTGDIFEFSQKGYVDYNHQILRPGVSYLDS
jgi:hypothetical protein